MKSGGQGLLNWLCVRVAGQQGVQVSARPRGPRGGESHVWGVRCVIASLAPHFHGEEALRKRSWVFNKLCLFKNAQSQLGPAPPSTPTCRVVPAPQALRETLVLWTSLCGSPFPGHLLASSPQSLPAQQYPQLAPHYSFSSPRPHLGE